MRFHWLMAIPVVVAPTLVPDLAKSADIIPAPPPPAYIPVEEVTDWSGWYVGGHVGYGDSDVDWTYNNINPYSAPGPGGPITLFGDSFSPDGVVGGAQIGVNHQEGNWVIGAEVSYTAMDLDAQHVNPQQFLLPDTHFVSTQVSDLVQVTARGGYAWDSWLGYVKGGYANAEVETRGNVVSGGGPFAGGPFDFVTSNRHDGWVVGGGIEHKLSEQLSIGVDYSHIDLGSDSRIGNLTSQPALTDVGHAVDADIDTVTLRLNWALPYMGMN